jgi:hypothetical protein
MDRGLNPFAPGAGRRPPQLVGRTAEIEAFDTIVARAHNRLGNRGMVLSGLRGVGKTVLLNRLRDHAERMGWLVVALEGQRGDQADVDVRRRLGRELVIAARRLDPPSRSERFRRALGSIESFKLQVGVTGVSLDVKPTAGRADSGDLETDLGELVEDLTAALAEDGLAFGLFIDEMQDLANSTLSTILAAQHRANQRDRPFYVIGAGLPSLPAVLTDARSYAERLFDYRRIGPLPAPAAFEALSEPVTRLGASLEPDALQLLIDTADGYPYFLQEYGQAVWDVAPKAPFTIYDAKVAVQEGTDRLDNGFFRARWDRATPAERKLLRAMAADGEGSSVTRDVAARMGMSINAIGPARSKLIGKGLVYAPAHGRIAYTVPGMAAFITRQPDDEA